VERSSRALNEQWRFREKHCARRVDTERRLIDPTSNSFGELRLEAGRCLFGDSWEA
jgi:hypothetical protein